MLRNNDCLKTKPKTFYTYFSLKIISSRSACKMSRKLTNQSISNFPRIFKYVYIVGLYFGLFFKFWNLIFFCYVKSWFFGGENATSTLHRSEFCSFVICCKVQSTLREKVLLIQLIPVLATNDLLIWDFVMITNVWQCMFIKITNNEKWFAPATLICLFSDHL